MSFISDQIKDSGIYDHLIEQVIDELEALEKQEGELKDRIKQLEQELAEATKDQATSQAALKIARDWARGDKWRYDKQHQDDWKWYVDQLDAAIKESK